MKKMFLLFTATAFTLFASCSDDDSNTSADSAFLDGTWIENTTSARRYSLAFENTDVTFARQDGLSQAFRYKISGNTLIFSSTENTSVKTEHTLEKVNDSIIKVGNLYLAGPAENGTPATITFKKSSTLPD
jgi:CCR4-NOT transcriptional regulation complex NOT5 subunit